jgi:hypothetical protein
MCAATRFADDEKMCTERESPDKDIRQKTIQKTHQHVVGASSPCIKKKCGCKFGSRKKGKCCCSKLIGIRCHSGCLCNENCSLFGNREDTDSIDDGKRK